MDQLLLFSFTTFLLIIHHSIALRCPDITVRYGRVKYRSRGRVAIFGCWAGFTLYGEKYAGCFRGAWDVTPPKCVRKGCSELSFRFGSIKKPLYNTAVLNFRCYPGYDLVGPKEIYCNGTSYDNLAPVCKREETDIACDFENQRLCKWRNDLTANLTFHLRQQAPPSRILNTGPDHDHTLDPEVDGYYLYLESSSTVQGETAKIFSPYLPHANDDNTCFKFWYHMYGSTIGALRVYINDTKLFEKEGNRGDRWRLGKVKLPSKTHFKIVVEAVTGRGYSGDIAIDDLDMGECTDDAGSTCADRCSEDESDVFATCDCHPGCADDLSCCNDYSHYCIAETTTEIAESTTSSEESSTYFYTSTDLTSTYSDDTTPTDFDNTITETDTVTEILTESGKVAFDDYHDGDTVPDEPAEITTSNREVTKTISTKTILNSSTYSLGYNASVSDHNGTVSYNLTTDLPNNTKLSAEMTTLKPNITTSRPTHGYNLRPRTTRVTTTPNYLTTINAPVVTKRTTKHLTIAPTIPKINTSKSPMKIISSKKPLSSTTVKTRTHSSTTSTTKQTTKKTMSSTKDPKITTRLQFYTVTINNDKNQTLSTSIPLATKISLINYTKPKETTDRMTELQTILVPEAPAIPTKRKSSYKPKGRFEPMIVVKEDSSVSLAGIFTVTLLFVTAIACGILLIFFLRRRRLSSRSSDGAEILFIPTDEMLDFNQATSTENRDSGVYSETVMSLKRGKR